MARRARQAAPLGPAAVAVHDDGDVQTLIAQVRRRQNLRRRAVLFSESTLHCKASPQIF
jgi:hypothetical protein